MTFDSYPRTRTGQLLRVPFQLWQRSLHLLARQLPGAESLRVWLHRLRRVDIRGPVFIGANVYIDDEFPQNVTLHEDVVLGVSTIIISHFRGVGKVVIERDVFIGPNSVILPNVTIGEGAVVAASSVVSRDVPPYTLVGGSPEAVPMARVTSTLGRRKSNEAFKRGLRPLRKKARNNSEDTP